MPVNPAWFELKDFVEGVVNIQESVTFAQFIEEEAIQTCALALFMAFKAKNYKAASWAMQTIRYPLLEHLKALNNIVGWMAPYSKGCFLDYIASVELMLSVYDELLLQAARG